MDYRSSDDLDAMVEAYVACALWSSLDDDGEPLDGLYSDLDVSPDALASMTTDCRAFAEDQATDLTDLDPAQVGHDFWLTRNHHGAGFWDRGLGELGDRLTDAAHIYGESWLYVDNANWVHVS